jgi:CheY-like chemotaxis protein
MSDSISIGWYGPNHDYWGWILGHFRDVTQLNDRNIGDWLALQTRPSKDILHVSSLLIAIDSRLDPDLELIQQFKQEVSPMLEGNRAVPTCVLLGDDWAGHRRTQPLPEMAPTFYWYELYDRILPWLGNLSSSSFSTQSIESNATNIRKVSPRVQRLIETSLSVEERLGACACAGQLALVISDTSATRQLWCETLARHEIQAVATTPENLSLWATPDFIFVDLESEPMAIRMQNRSSGSGSSKEQLIEKLTSQFPDAILIVADAFPRWENWLRLKQAGADLVIAKPFLLTGILDTLVRLKDA